MIQWHSKIYELRMSGIMNKIFCEGLAVFRYIFLCFNKHTHIWWYYIGVDNLVYLITMLCSIHLMTDWANLRLFCFFVLIPPIFPSMNYLVLLQYHFGTIFQLLESVQGLCLEMLQKFLHLQSERSRIIVNHDSVLVYLFLMLSHPLRYLFMKLLNVTNRPLDHINCVHFSLIKS